MERNIYEIELEIPNSGIFIMGLENENLIISLNIMKFIEINAEKIATLDGKLDAGELAKPLNPYIIYKTLEENHKNNFNGVKIIDKIEEENNIVYYFNFGLTLNTFIEQIKENIDETLLKKINKMKNFISFCCFSCEIAGDTTSISLSELENLKNSYGYEGKNYKSIFKKEVYINYSCLERIVFSNCEFKSKISLHKIDNSHKIAFCNGIDFANCIFEDDVNFKRFVSGTPLPDNKYYNNERDTIFENCIFNKRVDFHNSKFVNSVYFTNSHFKDYVDFHACEFNKIACFYGVTFDKAPNFSACYFKEPKAVNLINVDIDKLDFKSVEKYIEDNYQDETCENKQEITEEQRNNNCKLKCAKHLKDSFRVIKDVLITQNNTLEAQEWHKLELYAKERELLFEVESCYKEKNKPFIAAKSEDKNSINLTFSVLLLWIYRVTSLHHTNLPRIINFTSLNIVAFGLLVCLITYLSYHIDKQTNFWFLGVFILSVLVMAIVYLTLKKHKLKSIRLILFIFLAFLMALFLIQSITLLHLFSDVIFALFLYCLLVIALICLYPYINSISFVSYCFNWLVYFFLVMVVVIKPQLINPFAGIFSSDKLYESQFEKSLNDLNASAIVNLASILQNDFNLHLKDQNISFTELNSAKALIVANKENLLKLNDANLNRAKEVLGEKYTELLKTINQDKITENTIKSTSVLYGIILLLCIFSLQKTARKNSIVPS
ncbi:TPA: pentapeptide repeat-containing protein [Campylobacter jejuni]|nr:pentapeptide repeat-containing protein [Campylobacter jejuni]HED1126712.1 pentapeptide repeat-containing protein [Campylobacter jejuni]